MAKDNFTVSNLYCVKCGNKGIPVPRKMSKQREEGHLKKMYCVHCMMETNHLEYREFDNDFDTFKKILAKEMEKAREEEECL